jgi:hypothetical protein
MPRRSQFSDSVAAACVNLTVQPATRIVPVREVVVVFGATV